LHIRQVGRGAGRMKVWNKKVLVADEAIWVREGNDVKRIPWSEVRDVRIEKSGFWRTTERLVIECRDERITLPLTQELADRVRVKTLALGRAGTSQRR